MGDPGGEEEWRVHCSRPLPFEDSHKASHQGRSEDHVWQGDQGEGEARKDRRESLPCSCLEEADLDDSCTRCFSRGASTVGIPWNVLGKHAVGTWQINIYHCTRVAKLPLT